MICAVLNKDAPFPLFLSPTRYKFVQIQPPARQYRRESNLYIFTGNVKWLCYSAFITQMGNNQYRMPLFMLSVRNAIFMLFAEVYITVWVNTFSAR